MNKNRLVWSDNGGGDLRKSRSKHERDTPVNEEKIHLQVQRRTSGKGRTVIEIKGLPNNKKWCQNFAKEMKRSLAVGGTYKADYIEIHIEKLEPVLQFLQSKALRWKQVGG
jgi:translation initiation factor 1